MSAQLIDYYVNVKTADKYLAGTDNEIDIKIHGGGTDTGLFRVVGNSERNDLEGFTVRKRDVGKIDGITIDVDGDLADKWNVEYITVTRGKTSEDRYSPDGFYEFSINKEMSYNAEYFTPTYSKQPSVRVNAQGEVQFNKSYYTKVLFGDNTGSSEQTLMRYSETWEFVESTSMSTSNQTSFGASLTVSYDSPETIYGSFGAEASASWETALEKTRESANQKMQSSIYDWSYDAPANTAIFKKILFEIPYGYQVFSDGRNKRIVRKLNSQIVPSGLEQFLVIPKIENGRIVPISWSNIENEWLQYMDNQAKEDVVRQYKNNWIARGWVFVGNNPPAPPASDKNFKLAQKKFTYNDGWRTEKQVRVVADVNGDGKADIIGFGNNGVNVSLGKSDGTFGSLTLAQKDFDYSSNWRVEKHVREVADVNGDGRADIVGFGDDHVLVALGQSNGTFGTPIKLDFGRKAIQKK